MERCRLCRGEFADREALNRHECPVLDTAPPPKPPISPGRYYLFAIIFVAVSLVAAAILAETLFYYPRQKESFVTMIFLGAAFLAVAARPLTKLHGLRLGLGSLYFFCLYAWLATWLLYAYFTGAWRYWTGDGALMVVLTVAACLAIIIGGLMNTRLSLSLEQRFWLTAGPAAAFLLFAFNTGTVRWPPPRPWPPPDHWHSIPWPLLGFFLATASFIHFILRNLEVKPPAKGDRP